MTSKIAPLRIHVATLNSLQAINMLGGGREKVVEVDGQYSRMIDSEYRETVASYIKKRTILKEEYTVKWKAKGDREAKYIAQILADLEREGISDLFLKELVVIRPWTMFDNYEGKNKDVNVPFIFHPHPFKPSTFHRLKGRMPSFALYSRMKEIRKILSADLDDETKKRWRDILLINYPHEQLENQEVRQIWKGCSWALLLKESKGKFVFMEVDESKEV